MDYLKNQVSEETIPCYVDMQRSNLCIAFERHALKHSKSAQGQKEKLNIKELNKVLEKCCLHIYNKHYMPDREAFHQRMKKRNEKTLQKIYKKKAIEMQKRKMSERIPEQIDLANGFGRSQELFESELIITSTQIDTSKYQHSTNNNECNNISQCPEFRANISMEYSQQSEVTVKIESQSQSSQYYDDFLGGMDEQQIVRCYHLMDEASNCVQV